LIAFVIWVNGDGGVAKHGFGASSGDDEFTVPVGQGVGDVVKGALLFFMGDFDISEGGLMFGTEIDGFFTSVDEVIVPHLLEGGVGGVDNFGIKSEGEGRPIERSAEGAELELHVAALFGDEVPGHLVELFPAVVEATIALRFEVFFENDPSFEAGMVSTGQEPSGIAD